MIEPIRKYDAVQLRRISEITIGYYDRMAKPYWDGTRDHDVSQNYAALLEAIESEPPFCIVDLGCGPGQELPRVLLGLHAALKLDGVLFCSNPRGNNEEGLSGDR